MGRDLEWRFTSGMLMRVQQCGARTHSQRYANFLNCWRSRRPRNSTGWKSEMRFLMRARRGTDRSSRRWWYRCTERAGAVGYRDKTRPHPLAGRRDHPPHRADFAGTLRCSRALGMGFKADSGIVPATSPATT